MFKKIAIMYSIVVTAAIIGFFGGKITTENRLVEQHRLELDAARERAAVLTDTLEDVRAEAGAIGASLGRQRNNVAELRELIGEVRTRYEKMEELLSGTGRGVGDSGRIDGSAGNTIGDEIGEE